jgi:hypothetical protein
MSFDKFIQSRTIAKYDAGDQKAFPLYQLSSFIEFETDGYLVGIHFMLSGTADDPAVYSSGLPNGAIVAKTSGDLLQIPPGGNTTDYSGAQILISSLEFPGQTEVNPTFPFNTEPISRQTTIAYDADSKRIPIKSNDRLGVYLCSNGSRVFAYTLTAYFVRS